MLPKRTFTRDPQVDTGRAESITGWMSPAELRWLAEHALSAATVIEIGSFCGRSTRALADHCRGTICAIDPWDGYTNDDGGQATWILKAGGGSWVAIVEAFERNLHDHLTSGRVLPLRLPSRDARPFFQAASADLVFIDGDHRYDTCRDDIERWRDVVRPAGILAGHDYGRPDWPGVQRAVDELLGPVQRCESIWWVRR